MNEWNIQSRDHAAASYLRPSHNQMGTTMKANAAKWSDASALTLAVALLLSVGSASAQVRLTDAVAFGADATGNWFGQPNILETRPGGNFNNWIQSGASGGPFLNGPTDAAVQPNIALALGVHSFRILSAPGIDNPYFGINLFFNDSTTPSISAFGSMLSNPMEAHSFAANDAPNTPRVVPGLNTGYLFPGAGTLSFVSGDQLITLVDFYWATPSVYGLDLTGPSSTGPDGVDDYVGGITLSVTPFCPKPVLSIRCSQVELCWNSCSNRMYQLQYRSTLTTNVWTDLGSPVQGTGSTNCFTDIITIGQPQRYYRMEELP